MSTKLKTFVVWVALIVLFVAIYEVLQSHGADDAPSRSSSDTLLAMMLVVAVLVALAVVLVRRAGQAGGNVFTLRKTTARLVGERPTTRFADVGGVKEAKERLADIVDFLRSPDRWHQAGARLPRGVLLEGPPGCGKTLLARALAGEASANFFEISATEFVELFVGVGAARVRDLFEVASKKEPAIVFIDELDAVGRRRGAGAVALAHQEREHTLNQLLVSMDGFGKKARVVVVAATNRADVLDPALLRPGRFDAQPATVCTGFRPASKCSRCCSSAGSSSMWRSRSSTSCPSPRSTVVASWTRSYPSSTGGRGARSVWQPALSSCSSSRWRSWPSASA
jgi:ATP-dependent Zn protease